MANGFSLEPYNLVFLPGGHDKGVRQVIDSSTVHDLLGAYFPRTKKPSDKSIAAICHGVLVLAETNLSDGKSALHDLLTTTLPATFERTAYWGTWAFLGDYYKTYGAGSDDCETMVFPSCLITSSRYHTYKNQGQKATGRSRDTIQV
jgi:hypothetical protein